MAGMVRRRRGPAHYAKFWQPLTAAARDRTGVLTERDRQYRAALGITDTAPIPLALGATGHAGNPERKRLESYA